MGTIFFKRGTMNTINKISAYTLEEKKSKFHSFLVPYSQFEEKLEELKKSHPKARHFVTAFRYLNEYGQIVEGSSDDGEPKGTSGKPTLKVLQGHNLVNVAIITVRYFGGTLLGTGGLVRAYSDVANLAVANGAYGVVYDAQTPFIFDDEIEIFFSFKKNEKSFFGSHLNEIIFL